jgi:hypothetical protein
MIPKKAKVMMLELLIAWYNESMDQRFSYYHNPHAFDSDEGAFLDQCVWVELMRRPLRYERCGNYVMAQGFCLKHFRLWQNLERARSIDEEGIDPWAEAEAETRFDENPRWFG